MNHLIWLTEWESGEDVAIDPREIVGMERCAAEVDAELFDPPMEIGARTRVDTTKQMYLVRETPKEIQALAAALVAGGPA